MTRTPATKDSAPRAFALLDKSGCPSRRYAWLEPNFERQATEFHVVYDSGLHTWAQLIAVFRETSDLDIVQQEVPVFPEGWWEDQKLQDKDGLKPFI